MLDKGKLIGCIVCAVSAILMIGWLITVAKVWGG
jgi:hypothetical protein